MAKRYKDENGLYLAIDDRADGYFIGWYDPTDGSGQFVAYLGENEYPEKPTDRSQAEDWTAYQAIKQFNPECSRLYRAFCFDSRAQASKALKAANDALHRGEFWPEWAVKAQAAGWTPPKGWKPR